MGIKNWSVGLKFFFTMVIFISLSSPVFAVSERELFEKGVRCLKQDKYQEAVDAFSALIKMAPENPDAHKNRGVAYMKLNLYDQAIDDFERTKAIMPSLKGLHSNLGVAWYYKADYSKAIENYKQEILLSPGNHFAYFNRAICFYELKEYDKSLEDIAKTLDLLPGFYLALCLKGDLYTKMNQPQDAQHAYEEAISIDPDQVYAREQLARLNPITPPEKTIKETKKTISSVALPGEAESYELQAGAFQIRDNAEKIQAKLAKKGYKAKILVLTRPGQIIWYLVRSGVYSSQNEAQSDKNMLKQNLGIEAIVRPFDKF